MIKYIIEKHIPISANKKHTVKYPLSDLCVGDSFIVEHRNIESLRGAMSTFPKSKKAKAQGWDMYMFTTRRVDHGMRVWRIA